MIDPIARPPRCAAPAEGWISLLLVAMLAVVGRVVARRCRARPRPARLDRLPRRGSALGGVAAGFIGARAGWSRPVAHLVGAAFAALVVPVDRRLDPRPPGASPAARYQATASSAVDAVLDFVVRRLPVDPRDAATTSSCSASSAGRTASSRRRRCSATAARSGRSSSSARSSSRTCRPPVHDQIWFLVLFSLAALFLLTRLHALDERATWIRRRIGDPATVGSLYLRGGTVFIMIAVFGSLALTATARSAPLAGLLGRRPAGPRRDQPVAPADHPGRARQPDPRRPVVRPAGDDRRDLVDLERAGARDPAQARRRPAVLLAG